MQAASTRFSNVSLIKMRKRWKKTINTMIFKISLGGGVAPGDSFKITVYLWISLFFHFRLYVRSLLFFNTSGSVHGFDSFFQCFELCVHRFLMFWAFCVCARSFIGFSGSWFWAAAVGLWESTISRLWTLTESTNDK